MVVVVCGLWGGKYLAQRLMDAGDVADAKGNRVHVKALVVERQLLGVCDDPLHTRPASRSAWVKLLRASLALIEHLLVDVAHDYARPLVDVGALAAHWVRG